MAPKQYTARKVTLNAVARSKEFQLGFADVLRGVALRDEWDVARATGIAPEKVRPWAYERGRQYAVVVRARRELRLVEVRPARGCAPGHVILELAAAMRDGAVL